MTITAQGLHTKNYATPSVAPGCNDLLDDCVHVPGRRANTWDGWPHIQWRRAGLRRCNDS
jgi:hypothetical protein